VPLNTVSKSIPHDKRCEESAEHATAAKVANLPDCLKATKKKN